MGDDPGEPCHNRYSSDAGPTGEDLPDESNFCWAPWRWNGSYKPIEQVEVGDLVLVADSISGSSAAKPVVALISGEGEKSLVQVTLDIDGGRGGETGLVSATDEHPFWVADLQTWIDAI